MKIVDNASRSITVDLVVKGSSGSYVAPLGFSLENSARTYLRTEHGQIALRVISEHAVEVLMFLDGIKRIEQVTEPGVNLIEVDAAGASMNFALINDGSSANLDGVQSSIAQAPVHSVCKVPTGHNVAFVVVRFARENTPVHQPPQQEYALTFEMNEPCVHDLKLAQNFARMIAPPDFIDVDDVGANSDGSVSVKPKPMFHCTCTGCRG